ncbi:MAG: hypothetical protein ABIQ95_16650 [Bdellovibrionia bacterium]
MKKSGTFLLGTLAFLLIIFNFSASAREGADSPKVPDSWYRLDEDIGGLVTEARKDTGSEEKLAPVVQKIFRANQRVLDQMKEAKAPVFPDENQVKRPPDWVPWHFSGFATDMGITFQGLLGLLTVRSNPAVQVYWYKQGPAPAIGLAERDQALNLDQTEPTMGVSLNDETTVEEIDRQLEPVMQIATASGKVKNIPAFRTNMQRTVGELRSMVQSIESRHDSRWWFSKSRFDCIIDASGNILPAVGVGGELRFRFEWIRMKRLKAAGNRVAAKKNRLKPSGLREGLQNFVASMEDILESAVDEEPLGDGFRLQNYRVGIGLTANGAVGVARGNALLLGHVYFANRVKPPVIRPSGPEKRSLLTQEEIKPILLIEGNPSPSHLEFAKKNGVEFEALENEKDHSIKRAVYRIGADKLKKGIQKAIKIGRFFVKQANKPSKSGWKIGLLRCDYDTSVSGNLGLVGLGGAVAIELNFFNERF